MKEKKLVNDSERILRLLEEGFLRADTDGKIIMANEAIAAMCGYPSPDDMIGLHMKKLYANPTERDHLIKEIKEKGKQLNCELKLLRKDGSCFWSLSNIKTFHDEKGNFLGTEGVIRDITRQKQLEEQLQATNQQMVANEEELRAANQQLVANEQQLRASNQQLVANQEELQAANQQLTAGEQQLQAANQQLQAQQKELLISKLRLNSAEDLSKIGNFTRDTATGKVTWSDGLYHLLGYDQSDEIDYNQVNQKIHHPEDLERVTEWLQDNIRSGREKLTPNQYRLIHKDGKVIHTEVAGIIERNDGHCKIFATIQNISERIEQENKLKHLNQQLRAFNQQLAANEEELRASNQQLTASEQQLRASEAELSKQLEKSEKLRKANLILLKDYTKNNRKLKNIIENSTNLFYSHTVDNDITFISPQVRDILGYEPEEVMQNCTDFITDNPINKEAVKYTEEAIRTGKRQPMYELEMQRKDGSKILVEVREAPVIENGKVVSIVGSLADITNRKQAEEKLKASEDKFRQIYEHMEIGVAFVSLDFKLQQVNASYCEMLGYKESELVGKHLKDITHKEVIQENLEKQRKLGKGEIEHYRMEKAFIHKDGHTVDGILDANLIRDIYGKPLYFIGSVVNITERKQMEENLRESEEDYRVLAENARHLIVTHDLDGKVTYANNFALDFLNINKDQIIGQSIVKFIHSREDIDEMRQRQHDFITGKKNVHHYELKVKSPSGDNHILEVYGNPIVKNDEITSVLIVAYDITERKKAEEDVKLSKTYLQNTIDGLVESVALLSEKGEILLTNRSWQEFAKANDAEEASVSIGANYFKACKHRNGRWLEEAKPFAEKLERLLKEEITSFQLEYPCHSPDTKRWFACTISMFKTENKRYIVSSHNNITEKKLAEGKLQRSKQDWEDIFHAIGHPTIIIDREHKVIAVNNAAIKASGLEENRLIDMKCSEIFHGSMNLPINCPAELLLSKGVSETIEMEMEALNGTFLVSTTPIFDEAGCIEKIIHIATDITERKKAEEELKISVKERETLLRELYHRTKNNMQVIISLLSMKMRNFENKEMKQMVIEISNKIKSMALMHQKLYQSQDLSEIKLNEYVIELTQEICMSMQHHNLLIETIFELEEIKTNIDFAIPLGLIINELITNSIKYAFPGRKVGTIGVSLK